MADRLKGRVAIVTGSGQGLGMAIALAMAKEGAKVVTNNRRPGSTGLTVYGNSFEKTLTKEEKEELARLSGDAETIAQAIINMGGQAVPFFGDVSDFETARRLVQTAIDNFGKVDILVNMAGTFRRAMIWDMTEEAWDHVILAKLKGAFNCIRHASGLMKEQRWGRIINCTSHLWLGTTQQCNYAAANAGVVGLTRAVARDMYQYGVTCNAFAPMALTRALLSLIAYSKRMREAGAPLMDVESDLRKEPPEPEAIAPFIVYLATEEATNISGTVFLVAGPKISIYSEPIEQRVVNKEGGLWTVDELIELMPKTLLEGYKSPAGG